MPDVVDESEWQRQVSELKALADKYGIAYDFKRFPNGKERVVVEQWFNPLAKKGDKNGK